jgi:hypothetical protein
MTPPGRLFDSDPEQLALDLFSGAPLEPPSPAVQEVRPLNDQLQVGYGDGALVRDDEDSLARVVQMHSLDKDHFAYYYADIVSSAMTGKFPSLWWIELFAGPGRLYCAPENPYYDGSAIRAMRTRRPFDGYIFNDLDPDCVRALRPRAHAALRSAQTPFGMHVCQGDANG